MVRTFSLSIVAGSAFAFVLGVAAYPSETRAMSAAEKCGIKQMKVMTRYLKADTACAVSFALIPGYDIDACETRAIAKVKSAFGKAIAGGAGACHFAGDPENSPPPGGLIDFAYHAQSFLVDGVGYGSINLNDPRAKCFKAKAKEGPKAWGRRNVCEARYLADPNFDYTACIDAVWARCEGGLLKIEGGGNCPPQPSSNADLCQGIISDDYDMIFNEVFY